MPELRRVATLPGAGAAGGLGAALAVLGAELVPGAAFVLDAIGLRERLRGAALAVTGEGTVDATTLEGKAPAAVAAACREADVRCAVFGGRVLTDVPGAEMHALSGRPDGARRDLAELGERLGVFLRRGGG
jgi:glycerate kinase